MTVDELITRLDALTASGAEFESVLEASELSFDTHYAPLRDAFGAITGVIGVATHLSGARRPDKRAA